MFCSNCGARLRRYARFCDKCAYPVKENENLQNILKNQRPISGLRLNYVAYRSHFHFSLHEKDGIFLFSYDYITQDFEFVKQENIPVDPSYMRELHEIVEENDYMYLIEQNPPVKEEFFEADAPQYSLSLDWKGYQSFSISFRNPPPTLGKIKEFFISIAENISK